MPCTLILSRCHIFSLNILIFRSARDLFSVDAIIWKINYVVGCMERSIHYGLQRNIRLTEMWQFCTFTRTRVRKPIYLRNHNTIVVYYILKQDDLVWNRHRNKLNRKKNETYRSLNIVQVIRDTFSHCALAHFCLYFIWNFITTFSGCVMLK